MTSPELNLFAATLYGEAEPWNMDDATAIAEVIVNRAARPAWWGRDAPSVCLCKWQFSCWNWIHKRARGRALGKGDIDAENRLKPLFENGNPAAGVLRAAHDDWLAECLRIARETLDRPGDARGVTHYYASYIRAPSWAKGRTAEFMTEFTKPEGEGHIFHAIGPDGVETAEPSKRERGAVILGGAGAAAGMDAATGGGVTGAIVKAATDRATKAVASGDASAARDFVAGLGCGPVWVFAALFAIALAYMLWTRRVDARGPETPEKPWMKGARHGRPSRNQSHNSNRVRPDHGDRPFDANARRGGDAAGNARRGAKPGGGHDRKAARPASRWDW